MPSRRVQPLTGILGSSCKDNAGIQSDEAMLEKISRVRNKKSNQIVSDCLGIFLSATSVTAVSLVANYSVLRYIAVAVPDTYISVDRTRMVVVRIITSVVI